MSSVSTTAVLLADADVGVAAPRDSAGEMRAKPARPLSHVYFDTPGAANGALRSGRRLIPRIPFVLGGEFDVSNLYDGDSVAAMLYRGDMAVQLSDLPDGASITLRVVD